MHWTLRLYFLSALLIVLAAPRPGAGQAQNQQPSLTPFRDLFMDLDANSDNAIEKAEVPEPGRKAFERLLSHGDANHNGKLEAGEYRELLRKVNWSRAVSPEQLERRFKNLDRNQDGKLDRQEFQGGPARFSQLDRNGDGYLTRDEIPWLRPIRDINKAQAKKSEP
jgi:Ca2+-binding EF-hand superfamily protein